MNKKTVVARAIWLSIACVAAHTVNYYLLDVGSRQSMIDRSMFGVLNIWIFAASLLWDWED